MTAGPARRRWFAAVAVLPAAVAFLVLSSDFRARNSPVTDELAYLTSAKPVFLRGNFEVLEMFGTAPLPVVLEYGPAIWRHGDGVADIPWKDSPNDPTAIDTARLTTSIVVGIPLLALVVLWVIARTGSAWLGGWAGLMLALSPTFVAHATVAGTDACFALFFLLALVALGRHAERPTWGRFLVAGVAVGLAVASKYSGALLLPAAYLIGLVGYLRTADPRTVGGFAKRAVVSVPLRLLGLSLIAGVVVWATTGFAVSRQPPLPPPPAGALPAGAPPAGKLVTFFREARLPSPLTALIRQSAMTTSAWQEEHGDVQVRLHGRFHPSGHRLYYLYSAAYKSTLPELACAVLAVWVTVRWWTADGTAAAIGVAILAIALSFSAKQHGIRYLLAAYPLVFVLADSALHRLGRYVAPTLAVVLLIGQMVEAVGWRPWPISYMNRVAGGPERAVEALAICDGDWGQGRRELAEFLRTEGESAVLFVPGNSADADFYYGLRLLGWKEYPSPPCRYAAMSGAALAHPPERFPRIAEFAPLRPVRVLAHCLYVYDLSDPAVWAAYQSARTKPIRVYTNTP